MFCTITFAMLTYGSSLAALPCSRFDKVDPDEVAHFDTDYIPWPVRATKTMTVTADPKRTAIYDISARRVIMPTGEKLEAHSGLGDHRDDPRFTKVRMKGATPPNHYKLSLREKLFHGVRAIRLNPVNENKMFGRAGILAHPFMMGKNGDSNGCVSIKNYDLFLKQFEAGKVTDIVVVRTSDEVKQIYASKEN